MLSASEAGYFLNLLAQEFGADELSSGAILARAPPGMRGFFGRLRGPSSTLCSYEVSRFLSVFPGGVLGGFRLVSRVERGRTLWRVESADCKPANPGIAGDAPGGTLVCPSPPENACGLAPADYLAANLRKALRRQAEFLDLPLDPADSRLNRLIAEVANQTVVAVVHAQEKSLAAKRDDEHDRAMEVLFEERMKKAQLEIDRLNAASPSPFSYKPGLSGHRFSKG